MGSLRLFFHRLAAGEHLRCQVQRLVQRKDQRRRQLLHRRLCQNQQAGTGAEDHGSDGAFQEPDAGRLQSGIAAQETEGRHAEHADAVEDQATVAAIEQHLPEHVRVLLVNIATVGAVHNKYARLFEQKTVLQ